MGPEKVRSGLWEWLESPEPVFELDDDASVAELLATLRERGLDARTVDLGPISGKAELLGALHRVLELDEWFGFNWDALEEALHGPDDQDSAGRVLVCVGFRQFESRAPRDAEIFIDIVRSVASTPKSGLRGCVLIP
jgi:hypothetical protein